MNDNIHNLTDVKIPVKFKAVLSLGTKYCTSQAPNYVKIKHSFSEAVRKISWNIFFKDCTKIPSELDKWFFSCRKEYRKIFNIAGKRCVLENEIFDTSSLYKSIKKKFEMHKPANCLNYLISELNVFLKCNKIMVVEADKNAGLCIVYVESYKNEVMRQLHNLSVYHPTTRSNFKIAMIELHDKLKCFQKSINISHSLYSLVPPIDKPATFYILPKIHKPFNEFPKGRPISSTFSKTNKYASKLLDFVLKPLTNQVADLILDTQHFLLMVDNIKLDSRKKYTLVTVDIEALYPSLNLSDCKRHCINAYNMSNVKRLNLNNNQLSTLLNLSLDYNFIEYENEWFFQHHGIEMGNSASVMVANITVYHEVSTMFDNINECVFYKRFLDDVFMIIESENIDNMSDWLNLKLQHRYLKFTFEFNDKCINFLDTTVFINRDKICTELYVKPMSKHLYLHATSNHPNHLKDSLFYSQGLRIIRVCSDLSSRTKNLCELFSKFKNRWYDDKKLYETFLKLLYTSRSSALKPKKTMLIDYLSIHNKDILQKYNITAPTCEQDKQTNKDMVHVIFPFYNNIHKYSYSVKDALLQSVRETTSRSYKNYILDLNVRVVYSRTKNLKEMIK